MLEEIEQEFPALSEEEISDEKVDPFTEILEGLEGIDGTLNEEQPAHQTEDTTQTEGFSESELQQLQELLEVQQTETTTSIPVDVLTFNTAIHNMTVELSSVIIFCAFLIAGTIAAIKLWGARL